MKVGSRVICIDDGINPDNIMDATKFFPNWIKKGEEYIVRHIHENKNIAVGILLNGITNAWVYVPLLERYQEPAFAIWRFREVDFLPPEENVEENINEKELEHAEIEQEDITTHNPQINNGARKSHGANSKIHTVL